MAAAAAAAQQQQQQQQRQQRQRQQQRGRCAPAFRCSVANSGRLSLWCGRLSLLGTEVLPVCWCRERCRAAAQITDSGAVQSGAEVQTEAAKPSLRRRRQQQQQKRAAEDSTAAGTAGTASGTCAHALLSLREDPEEALSRLSTHPQNSSIKSMHRRSYTSSSSRF